MTQLINLTSVESADIFSGIGDLDLDLELDLDRDLLSCLSMGFCGGGVLDLDL